MSDEPKQTVSRPFVRPLLYAIASALGLIALLVGALAFWPPEALHAPEINALQASAEQGRYLAAVSNCRTCHTTQGGQAFI